MKKNKLSNFLKTGILLFGISILLWNCENENSKTILNNQRTISIEQVQKQFKSTYNESAFSKRLPTPNWIENKIFYNNEGNQYLEIPFQTINQGDIEKGTSVSFDKLIATSINNKIELKIVHFFGIDIKNNIVDFNHISLTELNNFSGFVTEYDLNKNVLDIKQYNKGKDTENEIFLKTKSKEENSIFARADESTWEYTETICTRGCWYWEYTDGSRENISCSPYSCTTTTYSGGNFGGGGNGSNGNNTSYNTNENTDCAPGYTRNVDGKCMIDDQVVNNLTGKEKCIYEKLKKLNLFKSTIKKFENNENYNLNIQSGNCKNSNTGCTDGRDISNGNITITMEEGVNGNPLGFASNLLHEGIHAEIFKYVDEHTKGIDPNDRKNLMYYYWLEKQKGDPRYFDANYQHQHMADKYIKPITEALRKLDNYSYTSDYYLGFAWTGLHAYGFDKYWKDGKLVKLTKEMIAEYETKSGIVKNNTKFNGDDCK